MESHQLARDRSSDLTGVIALSDRRTDEQLPGRGIEEQETLRRQTTGVEHVLRTRTEQRAHDHAGNNAGNLGEEGTVQDVWAAPVDNDSFLGGGGSARSVVAAGVNQEGDGGEVLPLLCSCSTYPEAVLGTGFKSVCGRRAEMEDAVAVVPKFFSLPFCHCCPSAPLHNIQGSCSCGGTNAGEFSCKEVTSNLHFFGVYDGHGGAQAANHCREHLHLALADELRERLRIGEESMPVGEYLGASQVYGEDRDEITGSASSTSPSFLRSISSTSSWPSCSSSASFSTSSSLSRCSSAQPSAHDMENAWREVWGMAMNACFQRMDKEVGINGSDGITEGNDQDAIGITSSSSPDTVGSTAVVAVVTCCQIIVANCGDSRAVLSRGGKAIALSTDHKPEREDELARIEAAGGRVICWNGYRVLGVLAMSRAIGDHFLKPFVIADPEVTCTQRSEDDECLILASDGLWDVLSNEDVCKIARRCLSHHHHHHPHHAASGGGAAQTVASVLVNTAHDRGSNDNISVVVVDLQKRRPSN